MPLVGRDELLDQLRRRAGGVVMVGPPGVGKTRLALAAVESARGQQPVVVRGTRSATSPPCRRRPVRRRSRRRRPPPGRRGDGRSADGSARCAPRPPTTRAPPHLPGRRSARTSGRPPEPRPRPRPGSRARGPRRRRPAGRPCGTPLRGRPGRPLVPDDSTPSRRPSARTARTRRPVRPHHAPQGSYL